jgi:hypothetical protein
LAELLDGLESYGEAALTDYSVNDDVTLIWLQRKS